MPTVLTVSHGTSDESGRSAMGTFVDAVRARETLRLVLHAHVDVQEPDVPTALALADESDHVVVVPLLLSRGFHVNHDLVVAADASSRNVVIAPPLGPDARLAEVMVTRLREAGISADDQVVLAAAGSSDPRGVTDGFAASALLSDALGVPVRTGFLSASEPRLADVVASLKRQGGRVVVASYLLTPGYFAGLAGAVGADVVSEPLLRPGEASPAELVTLVSERIGRASLLTPQWMLRDQVNA